MRRVLPIVFVVLLALILPQVARAADPADPWDPGNVERIISIVASPQLAPGGAAVFEFNLSNPYGSPMQNISLNMSIYQYATIEETLPVDASWRWAYPRLSAGACEARECHLLMGGPLDRLGTSPPSRYLPERVTILTSTDMPHGTVFAQSSYFLRFWLSFDFNNGTGNTHLTMASKGYFTEQRWQEARTNLGPGCGPYNATNRCLANYLNLTHLGVDGVLPDSAFGVKEPIPIWPFYGLLVMTGFFLVLAFLYWVEENPGRYPRIEKRWLVFKGRLRRVVRLPRAKKV